VEPTQQLSQLKNGVSVADFRQPKTHLPAVNTSVAKYQLHSVGSYLFNSCLHFAELQM